MAVTTKKRTLAACCAAHTLHDGLSDLTSERAVAQAGVFDPRGVDRLWRKCQTSGGGEQFSNADNMALVGVLSTQLLHRQFIREAPGGGPPVPLRTLVEKR